LESSFPRQQYQQGTTKEREEHQEHGALGVLTDRGGTQGGHRHEKVHIKVTAPKFA
jgi:hypothetical protein